MYRHGVLICALVLGALGVFFGSVHAVEARGGLVRGSAPAVYYTADDGKRYVFPNEYIYFSWYPDFSTVSRISDEALARYPIGGNVTYRPGTRLMKLQSDPRVYAIEPGGILREIRSETIARELYGDAWAKRVDDLPDGFFPVYAYGMKLSSARYPEGTLLHDPSTSRYYVIRGGQKRPFTDASIAANGILTSFAIDADTSAYDLGPVIGAEQSAFADTAQLNQGKNQTSAAIGEVGTMGTNVIQAMNNQTFAVFTISFRDTTVVEDPQIRLTAYTGDDTDKDAGGLVRGDGTQEIEPNIHHIRLVDFDDASLYGAAELVSEDDGDRSQTLTLHGTQTFAPGRHLFKIIADIGDETPLDERYRAELLNPVNIAGNEVTVKNEGIALTLLSEVDTFALKGQTNEIDVMEFEMENPLSETVNIRSLKLTGFIDANEEDADFVAGADADTGNSTFVKDVISSVTLVRKSDQAVLGTTNVIGSDGGVRFDDVFWQLDPGATWDLIVRVTVNPVAPYELGSDRIAFDIANAEDIDVESLGGKDLDVEGVQPNKGLSPLAVLTISKSGTLKISGSGGPASTIVMGETDVSAYELTFTADKAEDMVVDTFTLRLTDPEAARSVDSVELHYKSSSVDQVKTARISNANATFEGIGIVVPRDEEGDQDVDVHVYVNVATSTNGAVSGDEVGLAFEPATFRVHGAGSMVALDNEDFGDELTNTTVLGASGTVRKNKPLVSLPVTQVDTDGNRGFDTDVFRFHLASTGESGEKLKRLTFKLIPSDVGYDLNKVENDNDLLEYLAEVNGDGADDNDVVELIDESTNNTLGEGTDGHIDFSIYKVNTRELDTTPEGLDTVDGDYGIIVYEFTFPISIPTTGKDFLLQLDTSGVAIGNQDLQIELLGGSDFLWSDGTQDGGSETGDGITILPLPGPRIGFD